MGRIIITKRAVFTYPNLLRLGVLQCAICVVHYIGKTPTDGEKPVSKVSDERLE
jgi:hypothetical protein